MSVNKNSKMITKSTRTTYWHDALRSIKRALKAHGTISLAGETYRVAYEARGLKQTHDYAFLKECSRGCKCVWDVGANVGLTGLVMTSGLAEGGVIIALEASEASCLIIRENAFLNKLHNVIRIANTVVAERSGLLIDFHWDYVSGRSSAVMEPPSGTSLPLCKTSLSLDDFLRQCDARPEFIKIDVEGAESRVVAGMLKVLSDAKPRVVIELHTWPGTSLRQNAENILSLLESVGYQMVHVRTKQVVEDTAVFEDFRGPVQAVEARTRVLLLPHSHPLPQWLTNFDTSKL